MITVPIEAPIPISDLADVLTTIRDALGAMDAMATQIKQMKSMFDDSDGQIAEVLDAYDDAACTLGGLLEELE